MTKTALLTGATSGIGRALCAQLSERGVLVFATGRSQGALEEVRDAHGCRIGQADLSELDAPARIYAQARSELGGPADFVINNAGYNSRKASWVDVTDEEIDAQYRVNLRAPAILCREALRDMQARGSGHLVNVGSTVVHLGMETMGAYSAMKHGLSGLTKVLIKEARPSGIKVTLVHPGGTDTGFREAPRPEYMKASSAAKILRSN